MSSVTNSVFLFVVAGLVVGGMFVLAATMFTEPAIVTTVNSTPNTNATATANLISSVGTTSVDFLIPVILICAALIIISAIYLFGKRR